jgi:hypothetical protein
MKLGALLIGVGLNLVAMDAVAQVPAGWLGTWKLNVAKSKFTEPPPKSWIDTLEPAEGGYKQTSARVLADGKAARFEYTTRLDGMDCPYTGSSHADSISITKVDDYTTEFAVKKGGKVVQTGRTVFSRDGKLRTLTWKGTGVSSGQHTEGTAVFEKQ